MNKFSPYDWFGFLMVLIGAATPLLFVFVLVENIGALLSLPVTLDYFVLMVMFGVGGGLSLLVGGICWYCLWLFIRETA